MQLRVPPVEPTGGVVQGATVEPPGFTLVEEDDVAFSLQLCREVHRLYGGYQDGALPADDTMLAGLVVTLEMLAVLSRSVTDGMPGMRITVAAAQTREMLAVTFGHDPMQKATPPRLRERYRSLLAHSVGAVAAAGPPCLPAAVDPAPAQPAPATDTAPRSRLRRLRLFGRRRA